MNGFTNSILSILLGWLRLLIGQIWAALNSESGSRVLSFLQNDWKWLVLCLAAGGFLADRLVYFLRWRPDIVWRTRRRARHSKPADFSQKYGAAIDASQPVQPGQPVHWEESVPEDEPTQVFRGGNPSYTASGYLPREERRAVEDEHWQQTPPPAGPQPAPWAAENTARFDPVFDDDLGGWEQGDALVQPDGIRQAAQGMDQTFGASQPEPLNYIRDMQAGFARPLPPEQLYAAPQSPSAPAMPADAPTMIEPPVPQGYYSPNEPAAPQPAEASAPIHPGLDAASFQRNFGWEPSETAPQEPASDFYSFADAERTRTENESDVKPRNPFAALARKARDFVGVDADEDTRSIRDWQPTVPVHKAFHEPVYPKNSNHHQEGPSV